MKKIFFTLVVFSFWIGTQAQQAKADKNIHPSDKNVTSKTSSSSKAITSFEELQQAIVRGEKDIVIANNILCTHTIILPEQAVLRGEGAQRPLLTFSNGSGIGLSLGNTVRNLSIHVPETQKAIYTTLSNEDLGEFTFDGLVLHGQFSFIARAGVLRANLHLKNIDIVAADSRACPEMPLKYGVVVQQGALTIYNFNLNPSSNLTVSAENISIGRKDAPVSGSGVFISGGGDEGGWVTVTKLHTKEVYSTGKIPFGVPNVITAGVFIVYGVKAKEVIHDGEILTYGVNDMVLDAWGEVDNWTSNAPIISYGPSGIGVVNFGVIKKLFINAPLETHGLGARGYNHYDGVMGEATFKSITTFGEGSVGIQISRSIDKLTVLENITTHGSIGNSLVKGVNMQLPAIALSVKPQGVIKELDIKGSVITYGSDIVSFEVDGGNIQKMNLGGIIEAKGQNSKPFTIQNGAKVPIEQLKLK